MDKPIPNKGIPKGKAYFLYFVFFRRVSSNLEDIIKNDIKQDTELKNMTIKKIVLVLPQSTTHFYFKTVIYIN